MDKLCDTSAERFVISGILEHGEDAYLDVADFLQVDTFTNIVNQNIFKCINYGFRFKKITEIDVPTILGIASELHIDLNTPANVKYLSILASIHVSLSNVRVWAVKIRKLHIARILLEQIKESEHEIENITGDESISTILSIIENRVFNFASLIEGMNDDPTLLGDGLDEYIEYIENNPNASIGISSGFPYYDKAIGGGFRRQIISLISARIKTGKTMFATNVAMHVAKNLNIPVLYIDTEMIKKDHWARLLANLSFESKVSINEIETGTFIYNKHKKEAVNNSKEILKSIPIWYKNVAGKEFEEIISIIRRWVHKYVGFDEYGNTKDCLIIYDYFQLTNSDRLSSTLQEYQMLGFMLITLKNFAIRYNLPILCMSQSNREGIDRETTSVLAGSDRILWTVANYSIWKEKDAKDLAEIGPEHGSMKLVPLCARHGEGLGYGDYINFFFHKKYAKIVEGETKGNILLEQEKLNSLQKDFASINDETN